VAAAQHTRTPEKIEASAVRPRRRVCKRKILFVISGFCFETLLANLSHAKKNKAKQKKYIASSLVETETMSLLVNQ